MSQNTDTARPVSLEYARGGRDHAPEPGGPRFLPEAARKLLRAGFDVSASADGGLRGHRVIHGPSGWFDVELHVGGPDSDHDNYVSMGRLVSGGLEPCFCRWDRPVNHTRVRFGPWDAVRYARRLARRLSGAPRPAGGMA